MKNIFLIIGFTNLLVITGCIQAGNKVPSEKPAAWKKLKCGLFLSPEGELGFASDPEIANVDKSTLAPERCENVFITYLGTDHQEKLGDVIDTNSFEALGAGFFKDRSNIYSYYAMCDGGYLNVFSEDTTSFRMLGSRYAAYQSNIYHHRTGLLTCDPGTFKTSAEMGQLAKDKHGFFAFGERISEEQLKADAGEKMVERLKQL